MMDIVEGRIDDMIYTPTGKVVSPNSITNAMEAVEGIKQFRIIHERENILIAKLIRGKGFCPDTPRKTERLLKELVGEEMEVKVEIVNDIPKMYSCKIRAVISKVQR